MKFVHLFLMAAVLGPVLPSPALAQPWRSHGRAMMHGHAFFGRGHALPSPEPSVFPKPVDPWRFWGVQRPREVRPFFEPSTSFVTPAVSSVVVVPATVDASPSVDYGSPATAALPTPAPVPLPALIEYSTGWYQLRGDGVTTPYLWVWVPKPPAVPPAASLALPPADAGAPPPGVSQPGAARPPAQPRGDVQLEPYRWTDESGVTIWTNRLDRVPERYRDQARKRPE